MLELSGRSQTE